MDSKKRQGKLIEQTGINTDGLNLGDFSLYLLSFAASREGMSVSEVYEQIKLSKQPAITMNTAVLVFVLSYLHAYFQDENNRHDLTILGSGQGG